MEATPLSGSHANGPEVSVVIPCHNAEAWVGETVASVVSQGNVSFEIVLVDDGSSDRSVEIAKVAGGTFLRVMRQPNRGASHARNTGTAAARGAFIQYLDADDVLVPRTLRRKVDALNDSGADVAYCDWVRWERQGDGSFADGEVVCRTLGPRPDVDLLTDAWWPPGALLYRRSLVNRIGPWREDLPIIQDARFLLDAALSNGRFVHVNLVALKYRVHGDGSLSRRDPRGFLEDCYRNVSDLQGAWEHTGALDEERRRGLVSVYTYLARSFFAVDRDRFHTMVAHLKQLDPNFRPERPASLRALSTIVGYPAAEHVAFWWRHLKAIGTRVGSI